MFDNDKIDFNFIDVVFMIVILNNINITSIHFDDLSNIYYLTENYSVWIIM
jgi:hypothetical protein